MQQNKNKTEGGLSKRKLKRLMFEEKILSKAKKYMKEDPNPVEIKQEPNEDQQMKPKKAKKKKVKKLAEKNLPFGVVDEMDEELAVKKLSEGEVNVIGGGGGDNMDKKKKRRKKKKSKRVENPASSDSKSGEKDSKNMIEEGLNFLIKWENDKSNWKFEKLKQIWLIKNSLKPKVINDEHFEVFLRFLSTMKGQSRIQTKLEMQKFANDYESKFLSTTKTTTTAVESEKEKEMPSKVDKTKYERAKQMVQILSD